MYLEEFFSYIKSEKRFSDHTIISYTTDLNQFSKFLKDEYDIIDQSKASFKIIRNWVSILVESGLKSNSVNRKISTLKTFYKFLSMYNYSNSNPTLKLLSPKSSKRLPVFVEKENMNNLFDSNFFDNSFCGRRDKLIIELFYWSLILIKKHIKNSSLLKVVFSIISRCNQKQWRKLKSKMFIKYLGTILKKSYPWCKTGQQKKKF